MVHLEIDNSCDKNLCTQICVKAKLVTNVRDLSSLLPPKIMAPMLDAGEAEGRRGGLHVENQFPLIGVHQTNHSGNSMLFFCFRSQNFAFVVL